MNKQEELLKEYNDLILKIKELEVRKEEIRDILKNHMITYDLDKINSDYGCISYIEKKRNSLNKSLVTKLCEKHNEKIEDYYKEIVYNEFKILSPELLEKGKKYAD